ncbi:MAG: FadR family transcriptional regulator [Spirochaetales bacterium]|nr:FadR family transcriptional regulator [Spirochaetales bacterium]
MNRMNRINTSQIKNLVYEQCRNMIMEGHWLPGDKLPSENQLCEQLGVSRVSIRSALQSMEAQGLIEIRRGEGSFVNHFNLSNQLDLLIPILALDKKDVMEVLEYRIIMEPGIIPYVLERIKPGDIESLEKIYNKMEASVGDIRKFASLDEQFHLKLIDIISNKVIEKVYRILFEIFNSTWLEICEVLGVEDGLHYHHELIRAIRDKDVAQATILMHEHVERTHSRMSKYYSEKK